MLSPAHLTLVQWLSPAFPTGAFAYSHGLERAISARDVTCATSLERWLRNVLHFGAGWQDAILLCAALEPEAEIDALDALARAMAPSAERLQESAEQGAALSRMVGGLTDRNLPARLLPVAVGVAARDLGLPAATVAQLYLHGFAGNLCTIATRHIPLGQTAGQTTLARLLPDLHALGLRAAASSLCDLGGCALSADLAAMQHETMEVRIFRT